ncbi:unnamed protein product [Adineta ricciae]|uniref:Uncharacterized protein n=1 Tax=Adineta ricciae TaxID=249248 RepID=A0A813MRV8_ADIRI|nr:unnamed protein product [Adineta ricciae]CAF1360279.1 unnamed protein product [Adineta ricciae]
MQNADNNYENGEIQKLPSSDHFLSGSNFVTLNVALFPWASNEHLSEYCQVIEHYWYNILNNRYVRLNWLTEDEWDGGYHKIPQDYFDVYVYDALYINDYASREWLCKLDRTEIIYAHEINPNVLSLIECEYEKYYGIPIYGCFYLLFYRSTDKELASMKTFEDLMRVASTRDFIMRKPGGAIKTLSYLSIVGSSYETIHITEDGLDQNTIHGLSEFYRCSKAFLDKTDRYSFKQSSFYLGFTEDINTMLLVDEMDLEQIEFMLIPFSQHNHQAQCWLDCIGIHPQTKLRHTYDHSLQLANLMTCSNVMNECMKGRYYLITTNRITLAHLSSQNSIYTKLQSLIESQLFRPLILPPVINSTISIRERRRQAIELFIAQYIKQTQSVVRPKQLSS